MKMNNLHGLLALPILLFLCSPLCAQTDKTTETIPPPAVFEYSDVSLSGPSIYADEPFTISLTVKNALNEKATQKVELMLKDSATDKGKRRQASTLVSLVSDQSEMITFTFRTKDLLRKGEKMPELFVFYLGDFEIGVPVESN